MVEAFKLVLAVLGLVGWVIRIGSGLVAYVEWVAADPLMRRRAGSTLGLIVMWALAGLVGGVAITTFGGGLLLPPVNGDPRTLDPGLIILVVTMTLAVAALAGPKLSLLAARGWILMRGGEVPTSPVEASPSTLVETHGPVIEGGRLKTSSADVAVEVPSGWIAIDRTYAGLWEHPRTRTIDAFRWADAGFGDPLVPDCEILVDAWTTGPDWLPREHLRIVRIPSTVTGTTELAAQARSRLRSGLAPAPLRMLSDRTVELPAGHAVEVSYRIRPTDGSGRVSELSVSELHLLRDGWEYVLEFAGPTLGAGQWRLIAESLEFADGQSEPGEMEPA